MAIAKVGAAAAASLGLTGAPPQPLHVEGERLPSAAPTTISLAAHLLAQLDALSKRDPAAFRRVALDVARRLRARAGTAPGRAAEATDLEPIATLFDAVAAQGTLGPLTSAGAPHAPHWGPGDDGQAAGEQRAGLGRIFRVAAHDVAAALQAAAREGGRPGDPGPPLPGGAP
jgi:hypothetical protein